MIGDPLRARRGARGESNPPAMSVRPSAQYSLTLRVELDRRPGQLGLLASAIGAAGGSIGTIDTVEMGDAKAIREITVMASDQDHADSIVAAAELVEGCHLIEVTDRTFELHRGGKLFTGLKSPVKTRDDLSMAYTPGVGARVHGDRRQPRQGLRVHDQVEHGGRGLRRQRRARPGRHRPRRPPCP